MIDAADRVVLEFETEYYTDWRCARCLTLRPRTFPATVIRTPNGTTVVCRDRARCEAKCECECHCHTGFCDECGGRA